MTSTLPHHPFWTYSLQTYKNKSAKEALLALQNQYGLNVNVVLYCCWIATQNYGQIAQPDLKLLLTAIEAWHECIILFLRTLRNSLKDSAKPWAAGLREQVLAIELEAEHIEQLMLVDMAEKISLRQHRRTSQQRASNACHNIANYCRLADIYLDQTACAQAAQLLQVIFAELNAVEIMNICKSSLLGKQPPKQPTRNNQLQLKLRT